MSVRTCNGAVPSSSGGACIPSPAATIGPNVESLALLLDLGVTLNPATPVTVQPFVNGVLNTPFIVNVTAGDFGTGDSMDPGASTGDLVFIKTIILAAPYCPTPGEASNTITST